ncbi:MAG TPA: TMEM175 family protein [Flavisolibacter sp.]|nr:TMEM175 family protein [Flavisolibacter sp.]
MTKGRLEAFSDGVLAIIITIMVLELKIPHGDSWTDLKPLLAAFASYILSFMYIGIYWNNHHHMLHATSKVNGNVLWANAHLLFWLSLVPFATGWMGENHFTKAPVILYGVVLLMAGVAYYILAHCLTALHGKESSFTKALGNDKKGILSVVLYITGIALSFLHPLLGFSVYTIVAVIWFIPDKRFEHKETEAANKS